MIELLNCLSKSRKKFGFYNRNCAYNPFLVEGKKTVAYEIWEQMGFDIPDRVYVSIGDGCITSGIYKGFYDLHPVWAGRLFANIYTTDQSFDMLYIVNSGFLKTVLIDESGNEQVLSFPMKSDLLGVDGIHNKRYSSEAVALSDCDLILLPYKRLTALGRSHVELEHAMYSVMSRELVREQSMICMLGTLSAEGRVARFLVSLFRQVCANGLLQQDFQPAHDPPRNRQLPWPDAGNSRCCR